MPRQAYACAFALPNKRLQVTAGPAAMITVAAAVRCRCKSNGAIQGVETAAVRSARSCGGRRPRRN